MRNFLAITSGLAIFCLSIFQNHSTAVADDKKYLLRTFETTKLEDRFLAEGATYGDVNGDKIPDIIAGNFWYEGPDFKKRHEFYKTNKKFQKRPCPADVNNYSDNFFAFVDDINHDGLNNILIIQFPGEQAVWYENPGKDKVTGEWKSHVIFDVTDNESPTYTDLLGKGQKVLVCQNGGSFGYAAPDKDHPENPWKFHRICEQRKDLANKFTHGMGVGDVNGDGRMDILYKEGWFEQPASVDGDPVWEFHKFKFAGPGGSQMYVYDVDGDGLNDVITSLAAHDFGLSWFRQLPGKEGNITFEEHKIMGDKVSDNPYGVVFGELHAVDLIDMNGDGLKDIVTGKRWWSHGDHSDPDKNAGRESKPVLYWFELVRKGHGDVDWVPHLISDDVGVGTQVVAGDFTGDGNPDVVVSNKHGTHICVQKVKEVSKEEYEKAQPKRIERDARPTQLHEGGYTPEEAAKAMTLPEGFKVQLLAGEPDVQQPIAMCFDDRGRLWVAEGFTYPIRQPEGKGKDRILIFEDTKGNGKFDKRTVFAENLNLVSGLEVGFGGVWVGAAPYLLFIPDANGDDIPDGPPQVVLDGWGYEDTHETLNSFIWGPDGWLYGCHGVFTESHVGKPGTPAKDRTHINAGIWRYHPIEHKFERFIEGTSNPWGVDFNDRGHAFLTACVIPHLYHLQQGGRYLRQGGQHDNRYTFEDIDTIAKHRHWVGNQWNQADRNRSDLNGGGHAHAGAMFYQGGVWPEKYKDKLFMNNIHGSRLNMDNITRNGEDGASYVGTAAPDFCYANDSWSQILYLRYGPDGQVTMIDWYDKNQCHNKNPDAHDRSNGRIFKISYGDPKPVKPFDLKKLSDLELAKLELDKNDWYVRQARRILQERAAAGEVSDEAKTYLHEQFHSLANTTPQRLRCMWAIHAISGQKDYTKMSSVLLKFLDEEQDPDVRAWTIQLLAERKAVQPDFVKKFAEMAKNDPAPIVREYLASAMERMPLADRWGIAAGLSQHSKDASDHNLPYLYWYATEPLVMADTSRAMELARNCKIPKLAKFIVRRAAAQPEGYEALIKLLTSSDEGAQGWILDEIVTILKMRANMKMPAAWKECYEKLAASDNEAIRQRAEYVAVKFGDARVVPALRKSLEDRKAKVGSRIAALDALIAAKDQDLPAILNKLLDDKKIRQMAINAMAEYDNKDTPAALLAHYKDFTDIEKQSAIATLASRPNYIMAMLDAMQEKKIPTTDLSAFTAAQITRMKNEAVTKRLGEVWGAVRETASNVAAETKKYKETLQPEVLAKANLSNGRLLFTKTCGTCHLLYGKGNTIGPELTGSNRGKLDYLLENILDPSALVGKDYQTTTIITTKGRTINGIVKNENDTAVTLQTPTDLVKVDKADIDVRELSKLSLMPEGQLKTLKDNEIVDLIAYLQSPGQVPLPGEGPQIDPKTGKVAGAFEGENLKAGRHRGNWATQAMAGFKPGKWSGDAHGWWTGAQPGDTLQLTIPNAKAGRYEVFAVMTKSHDYGIVKLTVNDGTPVGPFDLYSDTVTNTPPISLGIYDLKNGKQTVTVEMVGANADADKAFMFGLDYISIVPYNGDKSDVPKSANKVGAK